MRPTPVPRIRRSAEVASALIGAQVVLQVVVWIVGAAALTARSPLGATARSVRLADAVELLLVLILLLFVGASVALAVWDRAARRLLEARGQRVRRPPTAAFLLVVVPPIGLTWVVFHELRELWSTASAGAADHRPRALNVWIWTYVLAVVSARFAVPPGAGGVDHVLGYLVGYLSVSAMLAITSGLALVIVVLRTTYRLDPTSPTAFTPDHRTARLSLAPGRS